MFSLYKKVAYKKLYGGGKKNNTKISSVDDMYKAKPKDYFETFTYIMYTREIRNQKDEDDWQNKLSKSNKPMMKEDELTGFRFPKEGELANYMINAVRIIFTHNNKKTLSIKQIELIRAKFEINYLNPNVEINDENAN
jgi:hypothetical protein